MLTVSPLVMHATSMATLERLQAMQVMRAKGRMLAETVARVSFEETRECEILISHSWSLCQRLHRASEDGCMFQVCK